MKLPKLTALQYEVMVCLSTGEKCGNEIRAFLKNCVVHSNPSFYQLMRRLVESDFLTQRYETRMPNPPCAVTESFYSITKSGWKAIEESQSFFSRVSSFKASLWFQPESPNVDLSEETFIQRYLGGIQVPHDDRFRMVRRISAGEESMRKLTDEQLEQAARQTRRRRRLFRNVHVYCHCVISNSDCRPWNKKAWT